MLGVVLSRHVSYLTMQIVAKQCHVWLQLFIKHKKRRLSWNWFVDFDISFDHKLWTRWAMKKPETLWESLFRTTCNDVIFLLLRCHHDVLQRSKHSSLDGISCSKNALLNHLQMTSLKIGYCCQYKFFHYDLLTVTSTSITVFVWSRSAECNEL